jgi:hypothetical protein
MRRRLVVTMVLGLLASLFPISQQLASAVNCPTVKAPDLSFAEPLYIDRNRAGGEPVSIVAQDGSISVSAHAGTTHVYKEPGAAAGAEDFAYGYTNQTLNWRSVDGGRTWEYVGLMGLREGPHSLTSTGFSDPDYAMDAGGRIYNTEIDLANVAVFSSNDDGQSYALATPEVSSGDRPWVTGGDKDEVFLYINLPKQLWRSTDAGITWSLVGQGAAIKVDSKILNDPRNFATGLIGPLGNDSISISADEGKTWTNHPGANLGPSVDFFGVTAVDKAGHVYKGAAGGYGGPNDTTPDGQVTFNYFNRDTESWGEQAVNIPIPKGDALWPWLIAGDDGRVAMVWYQNFAGDPTKFYAMVAYTHNAHGTTVTCDDGSTRFVPPQFTVVNASGRPIHDGFICLAGTTCNASANFPAGDRRLGDFFTVNFDKDGNLFIASGDTMLQSPTGGEKPVGNPIFIRQNAGDPIIAEPMKTRPTRCLEIVPSSKYTGNGVRTC